MDQLALLEVALGAFVPALELFLRYFCMKLLAACVLWSPHYPDLAEAAHLDELRTSTEVRSVISIWALRVPVRIEHALIQSWPIMLPLALVTYTYATQ